MTDSSIESNYSKISQQTIAIQVDKKKQRRKKRHLWNKEKKLVFLRIVEFIRPFQVKHGLITAAWQEYNDVIKEPNALGAKSAKQAYNDFLAAYHKEENTSKAKSGVNEEYTKMTELLHEGEHSKKRINRSFGPVSGIAKSIKKSEGKDAQLM